MSDNERVTRPGAALSRVVAAFPDSARIARDFRTPVRDTGSGVNYEHQRSIRANLVPRTP